MKSITKKLPILLILTILLSCTTDSNFQQSVFKFDRDVLAAAEHDNNIRILTGYVGIQPNSLGELVVRYADKNDREYVDQLFILQGVNRSLRVIETQAQLIISDGNMLIKTADDIIYIMVDDYRGELLKKLPQNFKINEEAVGYGLANWEIRAYDIENTEENFNGAPIAAFNSHEVGKSKDMGAPDCEETCDSGGTGSTSCSISGCSASCSEGYHACCQYGSPNTCGCCENS